MAQDTPTSPRTILFVCTGNTCRSPLAEALCKARLANRLGLAVADLPDRGFLVQSAGVAAGHGDAASEGAVEVAARYGAVLQPHRSRPVNPKMLAAATDVIAMTAGHAYLLMMRYPDVGPQPELLCGPDGDLLDPIGGDAAVYEACAAVIAERVDGLITEWLGT